jgi:hypothetical protein
MPSSPLSPRPSKSGDRKVLVNSKLPLPPGSGTNIGKLKIGRYRWDGCAGRARVAPEKVRNEALDFRTRHPALFSNKSLSYRPPYPLRHSVARGAGAARCHSGKIGCQDCRIGLLLRQIFPFGLLEVNKCLASRGVSLRAKHLCDGNLFGVAFHFTAANQRAVEAARSRGRGWRASAPRKGAPEFCQ